ncbi:MAG: hypothetical protein Q8M86_07875 [Syntrophales bacterium]|nr:hypothetical protein [Syntrophales bacterium]
MIRISFSRLYRNEENRLLCYKRVVAKDKAFHIDGPRLSVWPEKERFHLDEPSVLDIISAEGGSQMGKKLAPMLLAVLAFAAVGGMSYKADAEQRKVTARKANLEKQVKTDECYTCHDAVKELHANGRHGKVNCVNCHFHNPELARESLTRSVDESQKGIELLKKALAEKSAAP